MELWKPPTTTTLPILFGAQCLNSGPPVSSMIKGPSLINATWEFFQDFKKYYDPHEYAYFAWEVQKVNEMEFNLVVLAPELQEAIDYWGYKTRENWYEQSEYDNI